MKKERTKPRIKRPCDYCKKMFIPNSKENWMCEKCREKRQKERRERNRKRREEKLKGEENKNKNE